MMSSLHLSVVLVLGLIGGGGAQVTLRVPSSSVLMSAAVFIYCAVVVRSPSDLIVDVFEHVDTVLFWHQPSIVHAIKMWNCLTQHSKMHFSVWRRVFANSPQINGILLLSETIVCKTIGNLWESIVGAA